MTTSRRTRPSASPRLPLRSAVRAALAVLLVGVGLAATSVARGAVPADDTTGVATREARTWVVDAFDDPHASASWLSRDTGTSQVTIQVGDTVEWRFEVGKAAQGHDITSQDTASTWDPPVREYRAPGDAPVRYTFTKPGTYRYLCSIHGTTMSGTVVVEAAGATNQPPTAAPVVEPRTGTAPLVVHFTANGRDPDGDALTYRWDFGTAADASDQSTSDHAMFEYRNAGAYTATLEVTDGRGGRHAEQLPITVAAGPGQPMPGVDATARPASGAAPLTVAFSAEVTTGGPVTVFADGVSTYPRLTGTAAMVRRRGATYASLDVRGLQPNARHMVHVHEEACSSHNGGAHFRFDRSQPFAEANELWLPFTSDAEGRSGLVEVTQPQRAGVDAVSVVVHDPDNPARRIGCADLAPHTGGLAYAWDFGDGTTGQGTDPDHVYTRAGSHTATLTVTDGRGNRVTDTVAVTATPTGTATGGHVHPTPTDTSPPETSITSGPTGAVRADDAVFSFTSTEPGSRFACSLDGGAWIDCPARTTVGDLGQGRHRLLVRATDGAGNTDATPASREWTVDRTGPVVRRTRPATTSDRTPTVTAQVTDRLSGVRGRDVVLRVDGRVVRGARYDARLGRLAWTPRRSLAPGRTHTVRLVAIDRVGNRSVRTWGIRVLG